jgi:hypothetical protein
MSVMQAAASLHQAGGDPTLFSMSLFFLHFWLGSAPRRFLMYLL